jgi:AGZA family xanthine/uracil permease-like MFS transporter
MMAESFASIKWTDKEESIPAFFTMVIMAFAYNISYGIAAGLIFYCITKICVRKQKEVHPIIYAAALLFILYFVLMAVNKIG